MSGDVMIVVNTDFVPGKEIVEIVGLVRGNTIRAKHLGKDLMAGLRNQSPLDHLPGSSRGC